MNNLVKISAVGDVMFGEMPFNISHGTNSVLKKIGYQNAFENVLEYLNDCDFTLINLEAPFGLDMVQNRDIENLTLNAHPDSIKSIKTLKNPIVNLANNHILEHGKIIFEKTYQQLVSNDFTIIGANYNNCIYSIKELKGIKISFIGCSLIEDKNFIEGFYWKPDNEDEILNIIEKLKITVDHIIIYIHWGFEHINYPSKDQIELGHKLINAGATLVLGHHPHCYQGIEEYNNGIIVYSLGNFVFDHDYALSKKSLIFEAILDKNKIIKHNIIPIKINKLFLPEMDNDELHNVYIKLNNNMKNRYNNSSSEYELFFEKEYKKSRLKFRFNLYLNFFCRKVFKLKIQYTIHLIKHFFGNKF